MRSLYFFALCLTLAACGGGGGGSSSSSAGNNTSSGGSSNGGSTPATSTELAGRVIDGYISGATVCLDLNNNFVCDLSEPSAVTGAGGSYTFTYEGTIPAGVQILADVPVGAVDEDLGTVDKAYNMLAPAENPDVVTPLTTLVSQEILSSGGELTAAEAEAAVKVSLGVDDSKSLLGNDFIAEEDADLKGSAEVIAEALAVAKDSLSNDAVASTELSTAEIVKAAIKTVKDTVVTELIVNGKATVAASDVAAKVTTTVSGQVQNIVAATKSGDGTVVSLVDEFKSGNFTIVYNGYEAIDSNSDGEIDETEANEYVEGLVMELVYIPDATEDTLVNVDSVITTAMLTSIDNAIPSWYRVKNYDEDYTLVGDQLVLESDLPAGGAKVVKNCVVFQLDETTEAEKYCFVRKDVSGKVLKEVIPDICGNADETPAEAAEIAATCDAEAELPAESYVYDATVSISDNKYGGYYRVWGGETWTGYAAESQEQSIASFIDLHTDFKVSFIGDNCNTAFRVKAYDADTGKGTFEWADASNSGCIGGFDFDAQSEFETTEAELITFGTTELLRVKTPLMYRANNEDDFESYVVFAKVKNAEGVDGIFGGSFAPANTKISLPFTGNTNYGVFASRTVVDFVLEQIGAPAYPYEWFGIE
jgi:hypothetical protein